jgi:hypothetical protein
MTDAPQYPYSTFLDLKFPPLTVVDVPGLVNACRDRWYNQTLCRVNDSVVPRGIAHRTRAPERAVILMVETAAIVPTGDA